MGRNIRFPLQPIVLSADKKEEWHGEEKIISFDRVQRQASNVFLFTRLTKKWLHTLLTLFMRLTGPALSLVETLILTGRSLNSSSNFGIQLQSK
jgi:hypothetical protein